MRLGSTITAAAVAVLITASAFAQQEAGEGARAAFMRADANHDGQVTYEELVAVRPQATHEIFNRLDRNGDGVLSPADRREGAADHGRPGKPERQAMLQRLQQCDTNHDNKVTFDEFSVGFPKSGRERFDALDRNKDGVLSAEDAQKGGDGQGPAGGARQQVLMRLRQADADGDGKVTFEEASKAKPDLQRAKFDRYDTDKDGVITEKDIQTQGGAGHDRFGQRLRAADKDGDGRISFDEAKVAFSNLTQEQFRRFDRDGDGFITQADRQGRL